MSKRRISGGAESEVWDATKESGIEAIVEYGGETFFGGVKALLVKHGIEGVLSHLIGVLEPRT